MRKRNIHLTLKMPKSFDFLLQLTILILIAFGTLMIASTTVGRVAEDGIAIVAIVFVKQAMFVVMSYILMTFFANNFSMRNAKAILPIAAVFIIGALLSTQLFEGVNGSHAWIRIPLPGTEVTIQPSEFAKVFMIVTMAVYVEVAGRKNWDFWRIVKVPVFFFVGCAVAILLQKDFGTLIVLFLLCAICFLIPSHINIRKQQRWIKILLVVACVCSLIVMSGVGIDYIAKMPFIGHFATRISNAINPFLSPHLDGYQPINGLYGLARGGITGVGLGNSIQKYGYLTQSDNDYILSIVVEELGIFGLAIVMIGYGVIIQRLFYYAFRTKSEGYKVILIGTAMYIFIHFALNVGGVSGLIPLTGVPLLFISSGGSSLMAIMSAIGISQAVISRIRRQGADGMIKKSPKGNGDSLRKGRGETKIGG
ncbi:MAG: FtsW/RodA/SpoVE family cell cycle protein [Longicatena sp.]